jgi:hypothetical protein
MTTFICSSGLNWLEALVFWRLSIRFHFSSASFWTTIYKFILLNGACLWFKTETEIIRFQWFCMDHHYVMWQFSFHTNYFMGRFLYRKPNSVLQNRVGFFCQMRERSFFKPKLTQSILKSIIVILYHQDRFIW